MPSNSAQWLRGLLDRHDLERHDGRPLYGYQLSERDGEQMLALLESEEHSHKQAMLFCLYASWKSRTGYQGGCWSWDFFTEGTFLAKKASKKITQTVTTGLRQWGRTCIQGVTTQYLMTLVREGGLPLYTLTRAEGSAYKRLLNKLVQEAKRYNCSDAAELLPTAGAFKGLPASMSGHEILTIACELAFAVVKINRRLGDKVTSIEALDKCSDQWRNEIPLVCDSAEARALLEGLLKETTRVVRFPGIRMRRLLNRRNFSRGIYTNIDVPSCLKQSYVLDLFPDIEELPRQFYLVLRGPQGQTCDIGDCYQHSDRDYIDVDVLHDGTIADGKDSLGCWQLSFVEAAGVKGKHRRPVAIPGGDAVDGTDAFLLVFCESAKEENELVLVGQGTFRGPQPVLFVAVPADLNLGDQPAADLTLIAELPDAMVLYRLVGSLELVVEGERYQVRSGIEGAEQDEYGIREAPVSYSMGRPVYVGVPTVKRIDTQGLCYTIPQKAIKLRADDGTYEKQEAFGSFTLSYVNEGIVLYRKRVCLLPASMQLEYRKDGTVELSNTGASACRVFADQALSFEIKQTGIGCFCISPIANSDLSSEMRLALQHASGCEVSLSLPAPIKSGRFIDAGANVLPDNALVSLRSLKDCQARGYFPGVAEGSIFLELTLHFAEEDDRQTTSKPKVVPLVPASHEGWWELPLRQAANQVEELLNSVDQLDAMVEIQYYILGLTQETRKLWVARYDLSFDFNEDKSSIRLYKPQGALESANLRPEEALLKVQHIYNNDLPEVLEPLLQRGEIHYNEEHESTRISWDIAAFELCPGPWLFSVWEQGICRSRPTCRIVPFCTTTEIAPPNLEDATALERANAVVEFEDRRRSILEVLSAMEQDLNDPSWDYLTRMVQRSAGLPGPSLDLHRHLTQRPLAVALLLLHLQESQSRLLLQQFRELPFLWELVPLDHWVSAALTTAQHSGADELSVQKLVLLYFDLLTNLGVVSDEVHWYLKLIFHAKCSSAGETQPNAAQLAALAQENARVLQELASSKANSYSMEQTWPGAYERWQLSTLTSVPDLLRIVPPQSYMRAVLEAPIAAAIRCYSGSPVKTIEVAELKQLRVFDETYYKKAWEHALGVLVCSDLAN